MKIMHDLSSLKRIPIIDVAKRLGIPVRGTKAMCFMGHDKASASLSFLKGRNTWRCFGACGKHGDVIALVMEKENIDFKSALAWFSQNFGVNVRPVGGDLRRTLQSKSKISTMATESRPQKNSEFAADAEIYACLINHCSAISNSKGIDYLASHGISQESANRFNLRQLRNPKSVFTSLLEKWGAQRLYRSGIAWGKDTNPERLIWGSLALLFPFYKSDSVIYLQARMFEGERKYLNPRGITKPLFNTDTLSTLPAGNVIHICEGVPDALAMESHGLDAVGVLGATAFQPDWVDLFLKFRVAVVGHGDAAGEKFATDISNFFLTRGKSVHCIPLPKGKDAADILATSSGKI